MTPYGEETTTKACRCSRCRAHHSGPGFWRGIVVDGIEFTLCWGCQQKAFEAFMRAEMAKDTADNTRVPATKRDGSERR